MSQESIEYVLKTNEVQWGNIYERGVHRLTPEQRDALRPALYWKRHSSTSADREAAGHLLDAIAHEEERERDRVKFNTLQDQTAEANRHAEWALYVAIFTGLGQMVVGLFQVSSSYRDSTLFTLAGVGVICYLIHRQRKLKG